MGGLWTRKIRLPIYLDRFAVATNCHGNTHLLDSSMDGGDLICRALKVLWN